MPSANPTKRAFSILELVVTTVVLVVLVSILLPAVGHAIRSARSARDMSALKTHAQAISLYSADYGGILPYFTVPGSSNYVGDPRVLRIGPVLMFDAHRTWHLVLGPLYYDDQIMSELFFPSEVLDTGVYGYPMYTAYYYPCVFITRPEFWNPSTRRAGGQFAPTSMHEISYPSLKTLVVSAWSYLDYSPVGRDMSRDAFAVGMVDASARQVRPSQRRPGYDRGEGAEFISEGAIHFTDFPPLLHTRDGVRGLDVR